MSKTNFKNNSSDRENNVQKIVKSFRNNLFLKLILFEETNNWRDEFIQAINTEMNTNVIITKKSLVINSIGPAPSIWRKNIEDKLTKFCDLFKMEMIDLDQNIGSHVITNMIRKLRTNYLLNYEFENNSKLHIISYKENLNKDEIVNYLNQTVIIQSNFKKSIDLPKLQTQCFNILISLALPIIKSKYNLENYELNVEDKKINLDGLDESNVDMAIKSLNQIFVSFKRKRIDELSHANIIQYPKNLNEIIQNCLNKKNNSFVSVVYQIQVLQSNVLDESGVFLNYFYDCPIISSVKDNVYEDIVGYLNKQFVHFELKITKQALPLIDSNKWKQFVQKNFIKSKCLNNFSFYSVRSEQTVILLTGLASFVNPAKNLIEAFLAENQTISKSIELEIDDVNIKFIILP